MQPETQLLRLLLGGETGDSGFRRVRPARLSGPYTHVEVGFPSDRPEPWGEWKRYVDNPHYPVGTVYSQVPVGVVRALVELHGGERAD